MRKTLKDCPIHGHGANGLGCYCEETKIQKLLKKYKKRIRRDYIGEEDKGLVITYLEEFVRDILTPVQDGTGEKEEL